MRARLKTMTMRRWGGLYLAGFVVLVTAAQLGLLPRWIQPLTHNGIDKVLHFLLFGGIGFVVGHRMASHRPRLRGLVWLGLLMLCALDELSQTQLPHRSADPFDLLADVAGVTCFYWLAVRRRLLAPTSLAPR